MPIKSYQQRLRFLMLYHTLFSLLRERLFSLFSPAFVLLSFGVRFQHFCSARTYLELPSSPLSDLSKLLNSPFVINYYLFIFSLVLIFLKRLLLNLRTSRSSSAPFLILLFYLRHSSGEIPPGFLQKAICATAAAALRLTMSSLVLMKCK